MTGLLQHFKCQAGDYEFECVRQADNTCIWTKKVLNTIGARAEPIETIEDVPVDILHAFSRTQARRQIKAVA